MQELSDGELIGKYLAGQQTALEELIQRYFRQVFFFAKSFVKTDAEAEDVTQEVFVKAWKNLKKFDQNKKFKTWIFQIAKNTSIDFLRKSKNFVAPEAMQEEQMTLSLEQVVDESPLPEAIYDSKDFEQRLQELVNSLPPPQQLVVSLHLQQDLTFEEIAQILQEPLNTVKSRYRRALIGIRQDLNAPN